ncbi:anti-sigma factor family protein [Phyllobacterium brassicacearum]|nr:anti-sigma factor [Phyllobacterium brassicacearum]TDQ34409.1 anti-sigma factor RsiW [Phyllobacterium brassicacearum]
MVDLNKNEMPSDELLVAFLDGELEAGERERIDSLIRTDEAVAERFDFLSRSELPFYDAFETLLENAPAAHLESILNNLPAPGTAEPVASGWKRRGFIAAAIGAVFAGVAADRVLLGMRAPSPTETADLGWRGVVAEYLALYTPDTLANLPSDAQLLSAQLSSVGSELALSLPLEAVTLPGIPLKRAQILQYDRKPLGQIAYLDPVHGPLALCIVRSTKGARPPQTEQRRGMNVVFWSDGAHGFMLIGRNPVEQLNALTEKVRTALTV